MGELSIKLRSTVTGIAHWCPGCDTMHVIPNSWEFNNNSEKPTFTPSVKITWTEGEDHIPQCCHYNLIDGILHFHSDCTHDLKNQKIELPNYPSGKYGL